MSHVTPSLDLGCGERVVSETVTRTERHLASVVFTLTALKGPRRCPKHVEVKHLNEPSSISSSIRPSFLIFTSPIICDHLERSFPDSRRSSSAASSLEAQFTIRPSTPLDARESIYRRCFSGCRSLLQTTRSNPALYAASSTPLATSAKNGLRISLTIKPRV